MEILFFFIAIIIIIVIGFIKTKRQISSLMKEIEVVSDYRNKLINYGNKYFQNKSTKQKDYYWLVENSEIIQSHIGPYGLGTFRNPLGGFEIKNYRIISHNIVRFNKDITQHDYKNMDDCLISALGVLKENVSRFTKYNKNPFIWFREGMKEILSLPLRLLQLFRIMGSKTVNFIANSVVYKILNVLVTLITITGGFMAIVLGFDKFIEIVKTFFL